MRTAPARFDWSRGSLKVRGAESIGRSFLPSARLLRAAGFTCARTLVPDNQLDGRDSLVITSNARPGVCDCRTKKSVTARLLRNVQRDRSTGIDPSRRTSVSEG